MVDHVNDKTRVPQDGPEEVAKPKPKTETVDAPTTEFKVAELRDGIAILEMEDGRVFPAEIKEGLELKKHAHVTVKYDEANKDDVPIGATVVKVK